jgi:tetratricopeptide (TPR) repeat protein
MRVAVALLVLAALAAPVSAAGDDEERARGHYEIGLGLYRLGDYRGALKEFGAGYELAHKPGFLLNLGQTYRKLGELREARDMYRQFLSAVRGDDPARPQAQKVLAEIEDAIRKEPPAREPPRDVPREPTSEPPPAEATPEVPAAPPPAQPEPAPVVHAAAPIHRPHRALRIAGITIGVVGLGLVGGGVGAAVAADDMARDLNAADAAGAAFDPSKDRAFSLDRGLSIGLFAGGAALAATGAVLLIVSAR